MERLDANEIVQFFKQKKTYEEISILLQNRFPGQKGFSVTSIKRFCKNHGISPRVSSNYVEEVVGAAVEEVSLFGIINKTFMAKTFLCVYGLISVCFRCHNGSHCQTQIKP